MNPQLPVQSVTDLIAAQRESRQAHLRLRGNGTGVHLAGELFKTMAGVDLVHVPYKGSAPALTDLMAGPGPIMFAPSASVIPAVKAGKLRALAVTTARALADRSGRADGGRSRGGGLRSDPWHGLAGPAAMPRELVRRLNAEAAKAAGSGAFRGRMEPLGFEIVTSTPEKMVEMLAADSARWAPVIKAAGVTIN